MSQTVGCLASRSASAARMPRSDTTPTTRWFSHTGRWWIECDCIIACASSRLAVGAIAKGNGVMTDLIRGTRRMVEATLARGAELRQATQPAIQARRAAGAISVLTATLAHANPKLPVTNPAVP
jgi:hypothetical protein